MYAPFFGLSQDPFSIAPDPRFLFMSERHREALAHLLYGLDGGGGFVLLSGQIGTGKTTVCRCFIEQIPANCNLAYIFNPKLSVPELLASICDEFQIQLPHGLASNKDYTDALNTFLLQAHAQGRNNVLIIDEAQNLSAEVLEQLRLLTNLETNERKLLQIVLIGQSELRHMLARPELEQLAQRVVARFHLDALSQAETAQYIGHRLAVAGQSQAKNSSPFDERAIRQIHRLSRGVPRRINLLCGRALLGAYAEGLTRLNRHIIARAAAEVFGPRIQPDSAPVSAKNSRRAVALASTGSLFLGAALLAAGLWVWPHTMRATEKFSPILAQDQATQEASLDASDSLQQTGPAVLSATEFDALMQANRLGENQAWQALGLSWGLDLTADQPCESASRQQTHCMKNADTNLSVIRQLDRPGILKLTDQDRRSNYALLTGIDADQATLVLSGASYRLPLNLLAKAWQGDFSTLRRAAAASGESRAGARLDPTWLAAQLSQASGIDSYAGLPLGASASQKTQRLIEAVRAFQLRQGLQSDGQAGALTLMQLNRATGVDEPQLKPNLP